jgi:hypothetical protein
MILAPFKPHIRGGGVITAGGTAPDQALYWELVSVDPVTGQEGPPLGRLKWSYTKTDKAGLSVNLYFAPTDRAHIGKIDRVKVRRTDA